MLTTADYIVLGLLLLAVVAAVISMRRSKKRGCSGGCAGCRYANECEKKDKDS